MVLKPALRLFFSTAAPLVHAKVSELNNAGGKSFHQFYAEGEGGFLQVRRSACFCVLFLRMCTRMHFHGTQVLAPVTSSLTQTAHGHCSTGHYR